MNKVYIESKMWPAGALILIAVFIAIVDFVRDDILTTQSIPYIIATFVIATFLLVIYPTARIEISEQGFFYKKRKVNFQSPWADVYGIFSVRSSSQNFIVRTKQGTTAVIDHFSLRCLGQGFFCDFFKDFEKISGHKLLVGDPIQGNVR